MRTDLLKHYNLTDDQIERLRDMYNDVKDAYQYMFPRCTFFHDDFIVYKLAIICGVTNIEAPILKSELTMTIFEDRWKQICERLKWEYIPYACP